MQDSLSGSSSGGFATLKNYFLTHFAQASGTARCNLLALAAATQRSHTQFQRSSLDGWPFGV